MRAKSKARRYLEQAYRLDLRIRCKLEQLEQYREMAGVVTGRLQEVKVSSTPSKSPLEDAIIRIITAESELRQDVERLMNVKNDISEKISGMENTNFSILLELRYLCFYSWERIAAAMSYSTPAIYKQHGYALSAFEVQYGEELL